MSRSKQKEEIYFSNIDFADEKWIEKKVNDFFSDLPEKDLEKITKAYKKNKSLSFTSGGRKVTITVEQESE